MHFKFEELQIYQKALDFVDLVYVVIQDFPKHEMYNLSSQFKRAAVSIALNTAEGPGGSNAQFNRYLQMALNSLNECVVCATVSRRLNYITIEQEKELRMKLVELSKMITGLQKYLKNTNN